ncbi:hypothetical protein BJG93_18520 [Paraburkholderia sprentiae WSM5005]|uniref:Tyr recombinase domain-containing protein n=1 Tax=Paraburkholderia sprentiae WSM5005 TaxID=754502 RepID=A0A1I9YMF4_9BURK|nr:hypothetical protein [Paraburkholderia sprentiae]APA87487.1 hypothetical protein BJG93_18520 [Paraburkholderia sprentiae WSM5005]
MNLERFLPATALAHCDAVAGGDAPTDVPSAVWARSRAIWTLYRFAGVRLAELEWHEDLALPRIEVDEAGQWTLHVLGKGHRPRAIPLPAACLPALRGTVCRCRSRRRCSAASVQTTAAYAH